MFNLTKEEFLLDIYRTTVLEDSKTCQNGDFIFLLVCNKYGTKVAKYAQEFYNPCTNIANVGGFLDVVYKRINTNVEEIISTWDLKHCSIYLSLYTSCALGEMPGFYFNANTFALVTARMLQVLDFNL